MYELKKACLRHDVFRLKSGVGSIFVLSCVLVLSFIVFVSWL